MRNIYDILEKCVKCNQKTQKNVQNSIENLGKMCNEFLDAVDSALYNYYVSIQKEQQIEEIFHNRLLEAAADGNDSESRRERFICE